MKLSKQLVISFGIGLLIVVCIGLLLPKTNRLIIAAGSEGGDSYRFAQRMARLVYTDSNGKISIKVATRSNGTEKNLIMLKNNEAQLATAQEDVLVMKDFPNKLKATDGSPVYLNRFIPFASARTMAMLFLDIYQLVVRADSNIKTVADLEGKRVVMPPQDGGQIKSFAFLMQHYGLMGRDSQGEDLPQLLNLVQVVEKNKEKERSLKEKKAFCVDKTVDAVFHVRVLGNQNIREILTDKTCNARLLTINQAAAIKSKNPYLQEVEIPEGAYQGGKNPIPDNGEEQVPDYKRQIVKTLSVPRLLLARKDIDDKVIREITEIIYNNQQEFVTEMPFVAHMSSPANSKGIGSPIPIHPGSQAYYDREEPSWLEQKSGVIQVFLAFVPLLITLGTPVWLFLKRLEQIRKNKADDYIREVTALMDTEECIKAIFEYSNPDNLNKKEQLNKFKNVIIEKAAKILVEERVSELAFHRELISPHSRDSFKKTLDTIINAITNISLHAFQDIDIFAEIIKKAEKLLEDKQEKDFQNNLLFFMDSWQKWFGVMSIDKLISIESEKLKINLGLGLESAKTNTNKEPLESKILQIRQDLDAIFKRAVNALVEERISQDSFQSFRVIWQIAIGGVERDSHRSSLSENG